MLHNGRFNFDNPFLPSYLPAPSKLFLCVLQFGAGATTFCCPEEPKPGMELKRFSFLRCFADTGSCA